MSTEISSDSHSVSVPPAAALDRLVVQRLVRSTLSDLLTGVKYDAVSSKELPRLISDSIKRELKQLQLVRYKFIVQSVVGEPANFGLRIGAQCLWDCRSDKFVEELFETDSIFCIALVFAIYLN